VKKTQGNHHKKLPENPLKSDNLSLRTETNHTALRQIQQSTLKYFNYSRDNLPHIGSLE